MFPNGLSVLTHAFILLLSLTKRLIEFVAEKMRWDIFKFKMNLYLRLKLGAPLAGRAGDTRLRRLFSYLIVIVVSSSVFLVMFMSVGARLAENSNIDLILGLFGNKPLFASVNEDVLNVNDYNAPVPGARLPSDSDYAKLPDNDEFSQGFISLNFDDGWLTTYQNALPILNKVGLKSTQYIITSGFNNPTIYVSRSQVLKMQADGHEIGGHTINHFHLNQLSDGRKKNEITGSKNDLISAGVTNLSTFDYAHGEYNDFVITALKNSGFSGARTVERGFNTKNTDPFLLKAQAIDKNTTIEQVVVLIDEAMREKKWVILVFHQIDGSGKQYSATPEMLSQITDYLVRANVPVKTNAEGISLLNR